MLQFRSRAYTLIEVLVVVAIAAVLVRIAVPAYTSYRGKSQLTEVFSFMQAFQKRVEEQCNIDSGNYNVFGTGTGGNITDTAGNTVTYGAYNALKSVNWNYGVNNYFQIQVNPTYTSAGTANGWLYLYMVDNGNCNISWVCQSTSTTLNQLTSQYLPKFCSATNTHGN